MQMSWTHQPDFADIDVIRVGDTHYASASTMHYSPGAPVLRSYDLVNWEIANHPVSVLDFGPKYDLNGARGYVPGIWASSLAYRPSNRTFYWLGQIDFARTCVYTATAAEGRGADSRRSAPLLRGGAARRHRRHRVRGVRQHHHQRGPALTRRPRTGVHAAGVHRAAPGTTWPSWTRTPAAGCLPRHRSPGPRTAGPSCNS